MYGSDRIIFFNLHAHTEEKKQKKIALDATSTVTRYGENHKLKLSTDKKSCMLSEMRARSNTMIIINQMKATLTLWIMRQQTMQRGRWAMPVPSYKRNRLLMVRILHSNAQMKWPELLRHWRVPRWVQQMEQLYLRAKKNIKGMRWKVSHFVLPLKSVFLTEREKENIWIVYVCHLDVNFVPFSFHLACKLSCSAYWEFME